MTQVSPKYPAIPPGLTVKRYLDCLLDRMAEERWGLSVVELLLPPGVPLPPLAPNPRDALFLRALDGENSCLSLKRTVGDVVDVGAVELRPLRNP